MGIKLFKIGPCFHALTYIMGARFTEHKQGPFYRKAKIPWIFTGTGTHFTYIKIYLNTHLQFNKKSRFFKRISHFSLLRYFFMTLNTFSFRLEPEKSAPVNPKILKRQVPQGAIWYIKFPPPMCSDILQLKAKSQHFWTQNFYLFSAFRYKSSGFIQSVIEGVSYALHSV